MLVNIDVIYFKHCNGKAFAVAEYCTSQALLTFRKSFCKIYKFSKDFLKTEVELFYPVFCQSSFTSRH